MGFKRIQHGTEILNRSSLAYRRALRKTSCGHLDERLTDCGDEGENSICIDKSLRLLRVLRIYTLRV